MVADGGQSRENAGRDSNGQFLPGKQPPVGAKPFTVGNAPKSPGRPLSFAGALRRRLKQVTDPALKRRAIDEAADELVSLAMKAESEGVKLGALRDIADRIDGKPKQTTEIAANITFAPLSFNPRRSAVTMNGADDGTANDQAS